MPIRFRCPHCQQRLSIGTHKSGVEIECPTCKERVRVPEDSEGLSAKGFSAGQTASLAANLDEPVIAVVEDPMPPPAKSHAKPQANPTADLPPLARAPLPERTPSSPLSSVWGDDRFWINKLDTTRVTVPRFVIYSQGLLLGAVAVVSLIIGIFLGRAFSPTTSPIDPATMPCVVRGRVEYENSQGKRLPDLGALILALPVDRQPEKSIPSEGLGVDDPEPKPDHPGLRELEALGAKLARVDPAGRFEFRVPRGGKFYLIAVSKQARRGDAAHKPIVMSSLGKYIAPPTKLLGEHRYQMEEPTLREERNIDFVFSQIGNLE